MIRHAVVTDASAIATVHVEAWESTYRGYLSDERLDAHTLASRTERWQNILTQPEDRGRTFVFSAQNTVVGFVSIMPQRDTARLRAGDTAEFAAIYILKQFQRTGLGKALMQHGAQDLWQANHRRATVQVFSFNTNACRFYKRLGACRLRDNTPGNEPAEHVYQFDLANLAALKGRHS